MTRIDLKEEAAFMQRAAARYAAAAAAHVWQGNALVAKIYQQRAARSAAGARLVLGKILNWQNEAKNLNRINVTDQSKSGTNREPG
ncbi:MAG: hypothetical protein EHM67_09430 [Hyphomicrobiaceae bacterium]|nr:MAG: hypothetical protein EHM67_09430 [Hyphomicrobiaceae bacterium]